MCKTWIVKKLRFWKCIKKKPPVPDEALEAALDDMGKMSCWLWWMFILVSSTGVLNVWHLWSYVFIGADIPHWCDIEELHDVSWTQDELRLIVNGDAKASNCTAYNWNYTQLAGMSFEDARNTTQTLSLTNGPPGTVDCKSFTYIGSSIVSEFGLVCSWSSLALKTSIQSSVILGKFMGSLTFGFVSDVYGRKRALVLACILYMASAILSSLSKNYIIFAITRATFGMAGSGVFNSGFTLFSELCNSNHRTLFGNLYNLPYPLGLLVLPVIAYYFQDNWHRTHQVLCAPTILLIIHCILLPESPRWLIAQGRREEAWEIVQGATNGRHNPPADLATAESPKEDPSEKKVPVEEFTKLFQKAEIRWRTLICWTDWIVISLTYYVLTMSSDNFHTNPYYFIAIAAAAEAVSYFLPIPILKIMGRKVCCAGFLVLSGVSLISIMVVPRDSTNVIMGVAMMGRLCIGSVFSVIILYTSELFPTEIRNNAVGTSSTVSNFGSAGAPYFVEFLGRLYWFAPSTICGIISLLAGLLTMILPETRDKKLCDKVEEILAKGEGETTSLKNFWKCKSK